MAFSEDKIALVEQAIFKTGSEIEYRINSQNGVCHLFYFEINKRKRGQGLGRKLFERFEKNLPKYVKQIQICSMDLGSGNPFGFWEKMGFKPYPCEENRVGTMLRKEINHVKCEPSRALQQASIGS